VEEFFSEVGLPLNGVLRSSRTLGLAQEAGGIIGVPPVLYDLAAGDAEARYAPHPNALEVMIEVPTT